MQSLSKAKLSYFRKYLQKKTRESESRFLIEGWHLLDEALRSGRVLEALIIDESAPREPAEDAILARAIAAASETYSASSLQLDQLSDTKASQGVLALIERVSLDWAALAARLPPSGPLRIVALDAVADPGNCGAILRACAWFGVDAALCGIGSAEVENGKTARASMGGLFHLPIASRVALPEALSQLAQRDVAIVTAELSGAASLAEFTFPERAALVIGNEARGVSPEISALAVSKVYIPRFGSGESLNAAAAAAVMLARWRL